jgi:hypothetical protein
VAAAPGVECRAFTVGGRFPAEINGETANCAAKAIVPATRKKSLGRKWRCGQAREDLWLFIKKISRL